MQQNVGRAPASYAYVTVSSLRDLAGRFRFCACANVQQCLWRMRHKGVYIAYAHANASHSFTERMASNTPHGEQIGKPRKLFKGHVANGNQGEDEVDATNDYESEKDKNEPDFKEEDFTTVLQDHITAYRCVKDPDADMDKKAVLDDAEVKRFLKKAEIQLMWYHRKNPGSNTAKRLKSNKQSFFKNKTTNDVKYVFRKTAEDSVTAQLLVTNGFTLGVKAGVAGGPPMGGTVNAGVEASYSHQKQTMSSSSQTTRREIVAEVIVPAGKTVIVDESESHTNYQAECEIDFAIRGEHAIKYMWVDKNQSKPSYRPKGSSKDIDLAIQTKGIQSMVKELLARATKTKKVRAKDLPGFAECENSILQMSDSASHVHFSHPFQTTLTDTHYELQFNFEN